MNHSSTLRAALVALVLLPACAFGQQNFQPAKITMLSGDTLRGFINYRGWERNPKVVSFKTDLQAPEQLFRPLDIKEFSVSSERYAGAKVQIETSPQELDRLTMTAAPSYRADTVFLRALVAGPKGLYQLEPTTGSRTYFYIQQGGGFDLLVFKRYKQSDDGPVVVQSNNTFRDQLSRYFADCPGSESHLKNAQYSASSLKRSFASYYVCTNRPVSFQQRNKTRREFGLLAGVLKTNLSFSDVTNSEYPTLDSYTQTGPTGGIYYDISLPGTLGRFSIYNDLTFTSFKGSGNREESDPATGNYRKTAVSLELSYLKLHSMVRFTQPLGAGSIFLNAGISNAYAIKAKSEKTVRDKFYSTERTSTSPLFSNLRSYEQGFVAGLGGGYKKMSVEGRFEFSNGFLSSPEFSSGFDRYSLLVGYRLH